MSSCVTIPYQSVQQKKNNDALCSSSGECVPAIVNHFQPVVVVVQVVVTRVPIKVVVTLKLGVIMTQG